MNLRPDSCKQPTAYRKNNTSELKSGRSEFRTASCKHPLRQKKVQMICSSRLLYLICDILKKIDYQNFFNIILSHTVRIPILLKTRRPLGVNSGYLGLCMYNYKYAAQVHNVCIYRNMKANECSHVYIEVRANIL